MFHEPAVFASPGNWLEMQTCRTHPETLIENSYFNTISRWFLSPLKFKQHWAKGHAPVYRPYRLSEKKKKNLSLSKITNVMDHGGHFPMVKIINIISAYYLLRYMDLKLSFLGYWVWCTSICETSLYNLQ